MSNVVINGLTAVHAGSGGTLTTVDVCKTPDKCPPIPYTNTATSSNSAKTAGSVMINGNPACNKDANFSVSSGDEGGACGGVSSGSIKGMAEFITFSANVYIEGIPAVRQTDLMVSNNKNTPPVPLQQPGAGQPPELSATEAETKEAEDPGFEYTVDVKGNNFHMLKSSVVIEQPDGGEE